MFKMEITGETLEEFVQNCFNLVGKLTTNNQPAPVAPPPAPITPTPAPATPTPAPVPVPLAPAAPPLAAAPTYTYEQIGVAGANLVAANPASMAAVQGLLQRYGVQLVTDLKPDQLGPFATELRGLGAQI